MLRPLTTLLTLALSACGAVRLEEQSWQARAHNLSHAESFKALDPGDERALSPPLFGGSALEFRLTLDAEEDARAWHLTLTGPAGPDDIDGGYKATVTLRDGDSATVTKRVLRSALFRGALTVADDSGTQRTSPASLALGFFRTGFFIDPEEHGDVHDTSAAAPVPSERELLRGASLISMSMVASKSPVVRSLLLEVVQRPSLLSLLGLQFRVVASADFEAAEAVDTVYGRGLRFPVEVTINGDSALVGTLTALPPRGALELSAGIVEFVGFAPHRPDDILRLQLERARRPSDEAETLPKVIRAQYSIESP